MYQLQYNELEKYRKQFNCQIDIMAGDTDSFFLKIINVNLNTLLTEMVKDELLDTSKYDKNHPLYNTKYQDVIGKFKDESEGKVKYSEWIFLRPKCYSLLSCTTEYNKAKGVSLKNTQINHQSYMDCYENNTIHSVDQTSRPSALYHQSKEDSIEK